MRLQTFIIVLLISSLMIVGFTIAITDISEKYGTTFDKEDTLNSLNKEEDLWNLSVDISKNFDDSGFGDESSTLSMVKGGIATMKMVFQSKNIVQTTLMGSDGEGGLTGELGISPLIFRVLIAIMLIAITFAIISALMQHNV